MPVFEDIDFEGIEGIRVGRTNRALNTTCIVYRLGDTIIDTGPSNQWAHVKKFIEERDVGQVMITHHHEDHSGNGSRIQQEMARPIYMPPSGVDKVRKGFHTSLTQKRTWGSFRAFEAEGIPEEMPLKDGILLKAVHAPGHSHDMTCFLEPNRGWLFSGDVYIASRTKYFRYDENIHDQIASLERLLQFDFETLLCSHRGPLPGGKDHLRRKLDFLSNFRGEVLEKHGTGMSITEITRSMLGREDLMTWVSMFVFAKRFLVRSCIEDKLSG